MINKRRSGFSILFIVSWTTNQVFGTPCSTEAECPAYSDCNIWNHHCECLIGYMNVTIENKFRCIKPPKKQGDTCIENKQCTRIMGMRAICDRKNGMICACASESHFDEKDKQCYITATLGQHCDTRIRCNNSDWHCNDMQHVCSCKNGFKPDQFSKECIKAAELGEECESDASCTAVNSVCRDVCKCKVGYVLVGPPSIKKALCFQAADSLEWPCEYHEQCNAYLGSSHCDEHRKRCICKPNTRTIKGRCYENKRVGERCADSRECFVKNNVTVACNNSICSCPEHYSANHGTNECLSIVGSKQQKNGGRWRCYSHSMLNWLVAVVAFANYSNTM